ncbi:MAG: hypothetical protein OXH75_07730 [Acidobacteria bacterium]|nr:hypothetical protein [Acidobacteriota bacterium]
MIETVYVGPNGSTTRAREAAKSPRLVLLVTTRRRRAEVPLKRRDTETQRQWARRVAGAARLVRAQAGARA